MMESNANKYSETELRQMYLEGTDKIDLKKEIYGIQP